MLAILAAICFLLHLLGVGGALDLVTLGLFAMALHLVYPVLLPRA